jgi:hypothetical protein
MSPSAWASVAIAGVASHLALFALLHCLEPQLSPKASIISDYGQTASSSAATIAFLAFAAIWLALAIALSTASPRGLVLNSGRALFLLAAVGIVTGALFPETVDPRTASIVAKLQNLVARPGLFLGIILVSIGLRGAKGWGDLWPILLALSLIAAAMLPITIAIMLERGLGGVGQRLIFVLVYAWSTLVAYRVLASERSSESFLQ